MGSTNYVPLCSSCTWLLGVYFHALSNLMEKNWVRTQGRGYQEQQCCSSELRCWCIRRPWLQQATVQCAKQCQLVVTQPLAREQMSTCSWCQWWISLRLRVCAPARAYSCSCSVAVPAGRLQSSLHSPGEEFASALQACFHTRVFYLLAITSRQRRVLLPAMMHHGAQAVPSECSCDPAPSGLPHLLGELSLPAQPHSPVLPRWLCRLIVLLTTLCSLKN